MSADEFPRDNEDDHHNHHPHDNREDEPDRITEPFTHPRAHKETG